IGAWHLFKFQVALLLALNLRFWPLAILGQSFSPHMMLPPTTNHHAAHHNLLSKLRALQLFRSIHSAFSCSPPPAHAQRRNLAQSVAKYYTYVHYFCRFSAPAFSAQFFTKSQPTDRARYNRGRPAAKRRDLERPHKRLAP